MGISSVLLLLGIVATAHARCFNDCNNNGFCNKKNQCQCFRNYYDADCSRRLCQYGRAFVDSPLGDSNGDNDVSIMLVQQSQKSALPVSELYNKDYAAGRSLLDNTATFDEAHFYRECSGKGLCNGNSGLCECFPGYEGTACARTSCPNDCSGHGMCNTYEGSAYAMWDKTKSTHCVCDAGFTGPSCEHRVCPMGIDPVEASIYDTSRFMQIAFRGFTKTPKADGGDNNLARIPNDDVRFTITLTDEFGDDWTTEQLTVRYGVATDATAAVSLYPMLWPGQGKNSRTHVSQQVEDALNALPHNVAGNFQVHEIWAAPSGSAISLLAGVKDHYCGKKDITQTKSSDTCAAKGIVGCGVYIEDRDSVWWNKGGSAKVRNGAVGITEFIAGSCADNVLPINTNKANIGTKVGTAAKTKTYASAPGTFPTLDTAATAIGPLGVAYYQYPHHDVTTAQYATGFPRVAGTQGEWLSSTSILAEGSSNKREIFGLSLFIRFEKTSVQSLRIDYEFNPKSPSGGGGVGATISGVWKEVFRADSSGSKVGVPKNEFKATNGKQDLNLVSIIDRTSARKWDDEYWGQRMKFLDDQDPTTPTLHTCSKRGVCDPSSGSCKCFSGYTGNSCQGTAVISN